MFLILFCDIFKAETGTEFSKKENILVQDMLSPVFQYGFLRSDGMLTLII